MKNKLNKIKNKMAQKQKKKKKKNGNNKNKLNITVTEQIKSQDPVIPHKQINNDSSKNQLTIPLLANDTLIKL